MRAAVVGLLVSGVAHAEYEEGCELPADDLQLLISKSRAALSTGQLPLAMRALKETEAEIPCVRGPVEPKLLADFAGLMSLLYFFDQDEVQTLKWAQLRSVLDPDVPLGLEAPPPFIQWLEELEEPAFALAWKPAIVHPKKAAVYLNGSVLDEARAPVEVPVLIQHLNRKGQTVDAYWQHGVAFRREVIAEEGKPPPRWTARIGHPPRRQDAPETAVVEAPTPASAPPVEGDREAGWIAKVDETEWMPNCPWAGKNTVNVTASSTLVVINGQRWAMDVSGEREGLRTTLGACCEYRALRRYEQWLDAMDRSKKVNLDSLVTGGISVEETISLLGSAGNSVAASVHRASFVKLLRKP